MSTTRSLFPHLILPLFMVSLGLASIRAEQKQPPKGASGSTQKIAVLIKDLKEAKEEVRLAALEALAGLSGPAT